MKWQSKRKLRKELKYSNAGRDWMEGMFRDSVSDHTKLQQELQQELGKRNQVERDLRMQTMEVEALKEVAEGRLGTINMLKLELRAARLIVDGRNQEMRELELERDQWRELAQSRANDE